MNILYLLHLKKINWLDEYAEMGIKKAVFKNKYLDGKTLFWLYAN